MKISGENVLVAEYNIALDVWVLYGCARTCTLTLTTDTIDTSVSGSQGWTTIVPTRHRITGSLEGLVNLNDINLLSLPDLRNRQINRTKVLIRFVRTATDGISQYSSEFYAYIVGSTDEGPMNAMNSFSIEVVGTGALIETFTPTEILANVKRYEYTGTGAEDTFTAPLLIGKVVLAVHKDGQGLSDIIMSGTPVDKQVRITGSVSGVDKITSDGVFLFAVPFEANEKAYILYR